MATTNTKAAPRTAPSAKTAPSAAPTVLPPYAFARPGGASSLSMGIVGLPNAGKSSLFNRLTGGSAPAENYAFCTIDPSIGHVVLPDDRLTFLSEAYAPKKTTPATLTVVDIAGLVSGASSGEGLGNQFLDHIRNVDGILLLVRCFEDPAITHIEGAVDPLRDVATIRDELRRKDYDTMDKAIQRAERDLRAAPTDKRREGNLHTARRLKEHLETAWANEATYTPDELAYVSQLNLLTTKGVIILANISATHYAEGRANSHYRALYERYGRAVIPVCASYEGDEEKPLPEKFMKRLVAASYELLGLMNYFTAGKDEVRSWTIRRGTAAPAAATVIHTDFEKCFIAAEVMAFKDFESHPSEAAMRAAGLYRQKGRDYIVEDGDIIFFKQNAAKAKKK